MMASIKTEPFRWKWADEEGRWGIESQLSRVTPMSPLHTALSAAAAAFTSSDLFATSALLKDKRHFNLSSSGNLTFCFVAMP